MAQLNFPDNPLDGQLYPNPCPVGVTQYKWDTSTGMWRIVGVATGVTPGQYGNDLTVGQFTVDVAGNITQAANVPIRAASLTSPGVTQLNNTTTSIATNQALTAAAGKNLQDQIGNLNVCTVPDNINVVAALNDLQAQTVQLQQGALIWCGYYNAAEGDISFVSVTGQRLGYQIGQELPAPGNTNGGDFFIVTVAGNPYVAGDYNAPDQYLEVGNWVVSEVSKWSEVNAASELSASDIKYVPTKPLTATNVQNALFQVTQFFRTPIGGATISEEKPESPYPGQLWWDSDEGIFYIYYVDRTSQQWVEAGGGGTGGLASSAGVYLVKTGVGLNGGPITSEGEISLANAYVGDNLNDSTIGGVLPNIGFNYSNTTGVLDLRITSDPTGSGKYTAFSQEGANILNAKIDSVSGQKLLAGTYDASVGQMVYVTPTGLLNGFEVGENLPPPSTTIDDFYVIVTVGGDIGPDGPERSGPGDWYLCQGSTIPPTWVLLDFATEAAQAVNIAVTPVPGIEYATNAQRAFEALETQVQSRIQFCSTDSAGLQITVTDPDPLSGDGLTLKLDLDYSSLTQRGIVQLTSEFEGNSETLALSQAGANALNAKINSLSGATVLAGTYDAFNGTVKTVTPAGRSAGFIVGENAPSPYSVPDNYYLIVVISGFFGPPEAELPVTGVQSGDWFICENQPGGTARWVAIDYENREVVASGVDLSPVAGLTATNVQDGIQQIQDEVNESISDVSSTNSGITVAIVPNNVDFGNTAQLRLNPADSDSIGGVFVPPDVGLNVSPSGALSVAPASDVNLGGVKAGVNITIDSDGTINAIAEGSVPVGIDDISGLFDGVETQFPLNYQGNPISPTNAYSVLITLNGSVLSYPGNYDVVGASVVFQTPPEAGALFYGVCYSQG
jgi:hypothetical protein